jgi:hypothetical protein
MSGDRFAARNTRRWLPIILWTSSMGAQTCLVLSPATIKSDGTASLDLALYSVTGTRPAAVQWTFQYPSASVKKLGVDDGPALVTGEKTAVCAGDGAAFNCLTAGAAKKVIADGIIAKVTAVLAPGVTTAAILIKDALGTSPDGQVITISSKVRHAGSGESSISDCAQPKPQGQPGK